MDKAYTICLSCGIVQLRTDIVEDLNNKNYVFLDKKMICPKCHKTPQFIATKDIKKLRKVVTNSTSKLDQKINNYIRG